MLPSNDIPAMQKKLDGKMVLIGGTDAAIVDRADSTEEEIRREVRRACAWRPRPWRMTDMRPESICLRHIRPSRKCTSRMTETLRFSPWKTVRLYSLLILRSRELWYSEKAGLYHNPDRKYPGSCPVCPWGHTGFLFVLRRYARSGCHPGSFCSPQRSGD